MHLIQRHRGQNEEGAKGRVAPALVVEAARSIEEVEVAQVERIAEQTERGHLEVVPVVEEVEAALLRIKRATSFHYLPQTSDVIVDQRNLFCFFFINNCND